MSIDWKSNIGFAGLDDMFSSQDVRDNGEIKSINIDEIIPFQNHTFNVRTDNKLQELAESIKEHMMHHSLRAGQ